MANVQGRNINRVSVVDDSESFRETLSSTIEEADLDAVNEVGPLGSLDAFVIDVQKHAEALLCDHHLQQTKFYATFNGVEAVAALYRHQFPAVLCTRWDQANIEEIRGHRRFVPVLLKPSEFDPDSFMRGLEQCIDEFRGTFRSNRKPRNALVRIESVEEALVYVVLPSFAPDLVLRLRREDVPDGVLDAYVREDKRRFYAEVNLGAETQDELYFSEWRS